MITVDRKPFKQSKWFKVVYEFDKVYNLEVEKIMDNNTEYEARLVSYIDPDTSEVIPLAVSWNQYPESERAVYNAVEEAVTKYCMKHGIGEEKSEQ